MIEQTKLRAILNYEPESGLFRWRVRRHNGVAAGTVAGRINPHRGYRYIGINRRLYLAHRLAWYYVTGNWPANDIDHVDGDRDNNRWSNLRTATRSQNLRNARKHRDNRTGLKGVTWDGSRKKWQARIYYEFKSRYLGRFETKEEAHLAYCRAAIEIGGNFARMN